jgi:hypothetical protein
LLHGSGLDAALVDREDAGGVGAHAFDVAGQHGLHDQALDGADEQRRGGLGVHLRRDLAAALPCSMRARTRSA